MKSLPSATGSMRVASATAAPPLLPPDAAAGPRRCAVAPNSSLNVCEPRPNSGTLVLPMTMQPAAFMRCDHQAVDAPARWLSSAAMP